MKQQLGHIIKFRDSRGNSHIGKLIGVSENEIYIKILTLDDRIEFYSVYGIYDYQDLGLDPMEEVMKEIIERTKRYKRWLIDV